MKSNHLIRVVQVVQSFGRGGAERLVLDMLPRFDTQRVLSSCIVVYSGGEATPYLRGLGIPVLELRKRYGPDLRALIDMRSALHRLSPHIVHAHTYSGETYGRLGALLCKSRPKVLFTDHAVGAPARRHRPLTVPVIRWLDAHTDKTIVFSEEQRSRVSSHRRISFDRTIAIPNGVPALDVDKTAARKNLESRFGFSPQDRIVAAVGGLRKEKGFDLVIRAFNHLPLALSAQLLIIGEGVERGKLETLARGLGVKGVHLPGAMEFRDLLPGCDLYVNASRWESMSISILEAMSAGVAVVAVEEAGTTRLMSAGAGLVVRSGVENLAEGMRRLLQDDHGRSIMGKAARERVHREYSIEATVRAYTALYESMSRPTLLP